MPEASNKDCEGSRKKMRLLGKKLSLKCGGSEANPTTRKQDAVAGLLPSTARSTVPTICLSDFPVKQNVTAENMSVGADNGLISKEGYHANRKNLQLHGHGLPVTSEDPKQRSSGIVEDKLPNHLPVSISYTKDHVTQSSDDILAKSMTKSIDGSLYSVYKS